MAVCICLQMLFHKPKKECWLSKGASLLRKIFFQDTWTRWIPSFKVSSVELRYFCVFMNAFLVWAQQKNFEKKKLQNSIFSLKQRKKSQKVIGFCALIWNLDVCENKALACWLDKYKHFCFSWLVVRLSVAIVRLPTACDMCRCQYFTHTFESFRSLAYSYKNIHQHIYIHSYIQTLYV